MTRRKLHDCAAACCEGVVLRTHRERLAQGLPHVAVPNGDAEHDAALERAYAQTAVAVRTTFADGRVA